MLPPALKQGSRLKGLQVCRQILSTPRVTHVIPASSKVRSAASVLQVRAYCGRRRDAHQSHYNESRFTQPDKGSESHSSEKNGKGSGDTAPGEKVTANQSPSNPVPPKESNNREHLQQLMDQMRKTFEEDPYEALFGRSNRLLGRDGRRGWTLEIPNWWRKEIEILKETLHSNIPGAQAAKETNAENNLTSDPASTITSQPLAKSAMEDALHLEYDPISNRMVRKSENSFSHYGQDLDVSVNIPVKQYKPANEAETSSNRHAAAQAVVNGGNKPLQTSLDRYTSENSANRKPSFIMLKEEPSESQPLAFEFDSGSVEVGETTSSDVRAEYDQYKATRFPRSKFGKDDWLVQEGFLSSPSDTVPSFPGSSSLALEKRFQLEKDFNNVHSVEKEVANNPTLESKPWKLQRSKGTEVPSQDGVDTNGIFQKLGDELKNEKLDQKEVKALKSEIQEDLDSSKEIGASGETKDPVIREIKLAPESEYTKAEEANAMNEIMNYNIRVAKENLTIKEADARKEMAIHRIKVAESIEKARADANILRYQMQVTKDNLKNQLTGTQKDTIDYRARIAEAIEEVRAHAEILDINFSKMGHKLRTSHIRRLQEAKEKVQDLIQKLEESRKADYHALGAQKQAADLEEIKGAGIALAKLAGEFEATLATHESRVDQASANISGALTDEESQKVVVVSENNIDAAEETPTFQNPRQIPSLAEFIGYTPSKDTNTVAVKSNENSNLLKSQSSLEKEINEQKAAMEALETPRIAAITSTPFAHVNSAWPLSQQTKAEEEQDDDAEALAREIRSIYETKYGKITTSHIQPLPDSTSTVAIAESAETPASAAVPDSASASPDAAVTIADATLAETPPETIAEESVEKPASLSAGISAETAACVPAVPYTLLAYDSQTQSITRASFCSPPQASESIIPLTIALKNLHHPAKFLLLVQELRSKGYEPVHGEKNMLILRQMQGTKTVENEAFEIEIVGAKDEPRPRLPSWGATNGPRRTETVFSGAPWTKKVRKEKKKAWRRANRRIALGVAAIVGTIYVAGVMTEMTKVVVG
jgi:hypothetical protein